MSSCSVIIPALNEEKAIGKVIDDIQNIFKGSERSCEIIVVDDGSTDGTAKIVKSKDVRLIRHPISGGYGLSLSHGIQAAKHKDIVIIDADGTYPVDQIPEILNGLKEYDMVIGARTGKIYEESPIKYLFRKILQLLCEFVTGTKIPDVNSGLRVFKKDVVMQFKDTFCLGFSFTTTITLAFHLKGYFIKYHPIDYYKRIGRRAHVRIIKDSLRTAQIVTQAILYYNPIKLFLLLSIIVLLTSLLVFVYYFISSSVFALSIGSMLFLSSFIFFGMGLVTEASRVNKK